MKLLNRHLNMVMLLGLLLPIATVLYLAPVNALPVCGTITTSTYNFAGCTGTLTIGASNINLGCKSGATITATGNSYGIQIVGQSHVNVYGCRVTGATTAGIHIYESSSNFLTDNNASLNNYGFLIDTSFGNTLAGNTANSDSYNGFILVDSNNNTLASNKANSNGATTMGAGFIIDGSNFNVLSGNTATSNGGYGFLLDNSANHNTVTDNTANTDPSFGFYFEYTTTGNVAVGNFAKGTAVNGYNAFNGAGTANNFHTSLNPGIKTPYSGLQSP